METGRNQELKCENMENDSLCLAEIGNFGKVICDAKIETSMKHLV